jgi:hypothetical protein
VAWEEEALQEVAFGAAPVSEGVASEEAASEE